MYNKVKNGSRISVFSGANYQIAKINGTTNAEFYNGNIGFQYGLTKIKTNVTFSLSANKNITETTTASAVGPTIGASKSVLKNKIKLNIASSILQSYTNGQNVGLVYNVKAGAKYKINRKHQVSSNISYAKRDDPTKAYSELIATLGYNYMF